MRRPSPKIKQLCISSDELRAAYERRQPSVAEIAKQSGCVVKTVYSHLRRLGITRRSNSEAHKGLQVLDRNSFWKGGRYKSHGYIRVLVNGEYVFEHRHLMEQKIGRPLLKSEAVHHKNGIKSDNRLSNLELMDFGAHSAMHMKEYRARLRASQPPKAPRPIPVTLPQRQWLLDCLEGREPRDRFQNRSRGTNGGITSIVRSLHRRGFMDASGQVTDAGRAALAVFAGGGEANGGK